MNDVIAPLRQKLHELALSAQFEQLFETSRQLLRASKQEKAADTETVAMLSLVETYRIIGKFHEARLLVDGAHALAEQLAHPRLRADALIERGLLLLEGYFQPFEALEDFREALDIAHEHGEAEAIANALLGIACAYQTLGEPDRALLWAKASISTAQDLPSPATTAQLWLVLADIYRTQRRLGRARICLQHAQQLIDANGYTLLLGDALYQSSMLQAKPIAPLMEGVVMPTLSSAQRARYLETLATLFTQERDFDSARKIAQSYLEHAQTWRSKPHETVAFALLGYTHGHAGATDEAQAAYAQALELSREHKNPYQEAGILEALGNIAFFERNFDDALAHFQTARSVYLALSYDRKARALLAQVLLTHVARFLQKLMAFVRGR